MAELRTKAALGKYLAIAGLAVATVIATTIANGQYEETLTERFDPQAIPVFWSRILRIPDSAQSRALQVLNSKDFCAASPEVVRDLLGNALVDTKAMLNAQAAAAIKCADEREKAAAIPFLRESKEWMLAIAKAHRDYAAYTQKLSPELLPFLVKGQVYYEGTGGFDVVLRGKTLCVNHVSFGHKMPPMKPVAILVFLERKIDTVDISAGMAE